MVNITIKGQPCTIVSSNYTTVLCSTPAQGTLVQPTVTLANGTVVYPVSDGMIVLAVLMEPLLECFAAHLGGQRDDVGCLPSAHLADGT